MKKNAPKRKRLDNPVGTRRLYHILRGMKQRCYDKNTSAYPFYGGKGITVCDEWLNSFFTFEKWAYENGYEDRPNEPLKNQLSIDRIDSNGNYEPSNCQWLTRGENSKKQMHENAGKAIKTRWSKLKKFQQKKHRE